MSGKPGRPLEDRVERRREIWARVAPLIEEKGAHQLTMRQAAAAAFISLGGLYHYFPNKRALVLYGMDEDALERGCDVFKAQYGHLRGTDPAAMVEAFVHFFAGEAQFIRPAVQAALALGGEEFMPRIGDMINIGLEGFIDTIRLAVPDAETSELRGLGRGTRRLFFASLLDRSEDFEAGLRALLQGMSGAGLAATHRSSARARVA